MQIPEFFKSDLFRKILIGLAAFAGVVVLAIGGWVVSLTVGLPSARELENYSPPITSRVHAGDGKLVAEFANQHRVYVPYEEIPEQLIQAFISAEDKKFFEHGGVDYLGMIRGTMVNALRGKKIAGGSTITQQVVKNMLVGNDRSVTRKVRELIVAQRLEKHFTKEKILELYMNEIYLGGRSYGVGAASLNYFGKSLSELSLAQCALLASLPQRPSEVNPYNHPDAAVRRRNWVLERMAVNGYVTKRQVAEAQKEPLSTVERLASPENRASAYFVEEVRREILRLGKDGKLAGFANEKEATKGFYEGGLSIRSTIDTRMQLAAQTALQAGLETYDRRHGWRGPVAQADAGKSWAEALAKIEKPPGSGDWELGVVLSAGETVKVGVLTGETEAGDKPAGKTGVIAPEDAKWAKTFKRKSGNAYGLAAGDVVLVSRRATPDVSVQTIKDYSAPKKALANAPWRLRQIPEVQGALIAMDPHTGRVLAMVGGYSFSMSQFNRAVQAQRQPGSSFKPFVYSAAMDLGYTPASRVLDAPFVFCPPNQECYKPSNYSEQFYGMSTLRLGIEKSRNAMTVRLGQEIGMTRVSEYGKRFGIYDELPPFLSMSLGAGETTPLRMTTAYAMLVNGGKKVTPTFLDRIQNRDGKTVYRRDGRSCPECASKWSSSLQPPVFEDEREQVIDPVTAYQMVSMLEGVVQRGTATSIKIVGKPLAGKTGTTNEYMDAWFVGFSPDLVAGIWIGYDTPKSLGEGESGGRNATPIFRDFAMVALEDAPALPFRIPSGVRLVEIDADTGCLPGEETRIQIMEAFKPGTEPTERCAGENDGAGFGDMLAADEVSYRAPDGAASIGDDTMLPADPNAPPAPQNDLTVNDGIF